MSWKATVRYAAPLALAVLVTACASNQVPPAKNTINEAEESLDRAQQAKAYEFSALEFTGAQRKLDQAKELANSDDEDDRLKALRLAEAAGVDARLAEAKARLAYTRSLYQEMQDTVKALRQETGLAPEGEGSP